MRWTGLLCHGLSSNGLCHHRLSKKKKKATLWDQQSSCKRPLCCTLQTIDSSNCFPFPFLSILSIKQYVLKIY
jgi:hypothetical protein